MADEDKGSYLEEDDLLERIVPDPNHPDVNALTGVFVGKGPTADTVRVYTTLNLNQYIQIPRDKVLGVKRFPSGSVVVWVPADLKVQLIRSDTLTGDFLKGSSQSAAARRSVGASGLASLLGRGGPGGGTSWGGCQTDFADPGGDPTCTLIGCTPPQPPTGCSC